MTKEIHEGTIIACWRVETWRIVKKTPATVSLCDLYGLEKNFLPNRELWSHRSQDEVLHFSQIVSSILIWLGRYHYNQIKSRFFKKQSTRIVRRKQYIKRNNARKLTFAMISECCLCFHLGQSGMKSSVL